MEILAAIERAWSWTGLIPREVVADNEFGNVLVLDNVGNYWRICPEELSCAVVARSPQELKALIGSSDFQVDWAMVEIVAIAESRNGALGLGRKYCLVTPTVLGGRYEAENIRTAPFSEVVGVAGSIAEQIRDLPDGAKVQLVVKS